MKPNQHYVVLSIAQLESMIRQIRESKGYPAQPVSNDSCGVFHATSKPDSDGASQLASYELTKLHGFV